MELSVEERCAVDRPTTARHKTARRKLSFKVLIRVGVVGIVEQTSNINVLLCYIRREEWRVCTPSVVFGLLQLGCCGSAAVSQKMTNEGELISLLTSQLKAEKFEFLYVICILHVLGGRTFQFFCFLAGCVSKSVDFRVAQLNLQVASVTLERHILVNAVWYNEEEEACK